MTDDRQLPGLLAYDHAAREAEHLARQIRNAADEYRHGLDKGQIYLDRARSLLWILRRDLDKLPVRPQGHQPARLDGDAVGGDAA